MNFTISTIASSLASYLAPSFPGVTFYENPNQQGTETPCMFLQQRYSYIKVKTAGRFLRQIGLDMVMETFPYTDGTTDGTALLRTYDREWRIDLDAMHYKFELQVWVDVPEKITPMESMDYQEAVTDGN